MTGVKWKTPVSVSQHGAKALACRQTTGRFGPAWHAKAVLHLLCQVVLWRSRAAQLPRHPDLEGWWPAHAGDQRSLRGRHGTLHLRGLQQSGSWQHLCWGLHRRSAIGERNVTSLAWLSSRCPVCHRNEHHCFCFCHRGFIIRLRRRGRAVKLQIRNHASVRVFQHERFWPRDPWTPEQVNWALQQLIKSFHWALKGPLKSRDPDPMYRPASE